MTKNQVVSSLSYLSILFAPFIFPLIIWIICRNEPFIRHHAAIALWLQLLPLLLGTICLISLGVTGLATSSWKITGAMIVILLGIIALVTLLIFIYNLYKGIKLLVA